MSTQQKINIRNGVLVLMIVVATSVRMLNPGNIVTWANFTPVGAVALFGGAYFSDKWKAYLVPLVVLLISDLVINYTKYDKVGLYNGAWIVYLSFAVMVFIGTLIKKVSALKVILASVTAVVIHWLLTDMTFGSTFYGPGLTGYFQSLTAAIPFEAKMIWGTLLFSALLFGGFEAAKTKYAVLQVQPQVA
ncbi:hypothetical protein BEL04_04215 [Mucilaginibacter sp. PPCGB 2223]|uniref:DUF6580 family putative transport protein n=1 Tax=Mucilaginibacter sp. PPCGB 2223 TaxID=1886027 RepID=UPI00082599E3|nr:DUF6580 family putative transport protein [Mucilaginibacter sp. PPCGB 2223]OCX53512.1 hypothetical protein BEL04_04215 [Mucilaginibacter sp. PPCGB 2223]